MFRLIKICTKDENENIWDKTLYILQKSGKGFSILFRIIKTVAVWELGRLERSSQSWQPLGK